MLPKIDAPVLYTAQGTPYLREPGVVMIARPHVDLSGMQTFLDGFDPTLGYDDYLADPVPLPDGEQLVKVAGQLCYMSFGPKRTWNRDAKSYFDGSAERKQHGIKPSKHGSVLAHAKYSFLFYGIARSNTHEIVRHGVGCAYSQLSQRYVGGRQVRFIQRPEYVGDEFLQRKFEERINRAKAEYEEITAYLMDLQARGGRKILSAEGRTDLLKKVRQVSRSLLPNETEAPIIMSANVRAWRHVCEMRAAEDTDTEIRELFIRVHKCLVQEAPLLFGDHTLVDYPDGTQGIETPWRKV